MSRRVVPLLCLAIAVVLTVAALGVYVHTGPDGATPLGPSAPDPAIAAGRIQAVLPELEAFVARERGLAFKTPVEVKLLGEAAFRARAREVDDQDREELRDVQAVLQAMGLLKPDVNLEAVVKSFSEEAILGFYDPESKELVVRGASPTPFVRSVLVHELTHALEDQYFDLNRDDLGDEATIGFDALAEGSALRIEERFRRSLSDKDRRAAEKAEEGFSGGVSKDIPEVIQFAFGFPYAYGPELVKAIVVAGGQARLDAAFVNPPASSEQVLEPQRYLRGDAPRAVPLPRADRPAFDDGEIGELFLVLMLRAELDDDTGLDAARGWGGDHYVAWRAGRRTCVRMSFVMDTAKDTAELDKALAGWAAKRHGQASATGTTLTTCG